MSDNSFENSFQAVCDKLVGLAKKQGVLGTPIEVGDTIVIPLSELKLGFGGGGGEGVGEGDNDSGGKGRGKAMASGGVGTVKVNPVAFVVVTGDTVTLETLED